MIKSLIIEDDHTSSLFLEMILHKYGDTHVSVNGEQAVKAFCEAMDTGHPYDLVCLDILLPDMDGHGVLKNLRQIEKERNPQGITGASIIMTTTLNDTQTIKRSFRGHCDAFMIKPIHAIDLINRLKSFSLI